MKRTNLTRLIISLVLLISLMPIPAALAASPVHTVHAAANITHNNATISTRITNPGSPAITQCGFQLGLKSNELTTKKYDTVKSQKWSYVDASFSMSKYGVTLKANTTYYYRFYLISGGKTSYGPVKSFKTLPEPTVQAPVFTVHTPASITQTNATISAKITNPGSPAITQCGFMMGTSSTNLSTKKYDTVQSQKWSYVDTSFSMSKYGVTLKADTTYYYQFYLISGGKTHLGPVKSFKTLPAGTTVYKPITSLSVRRIVQPKGDPYGSCYLSSIATVYAYGKGTVDKVNYRTGGADIAQTASKVYKDFKAKNGGTYVYDSTMNYYGLKKTSFSLTAVYEALKAGKPVAMYNGIHASVIIGYKGNGNTLKAEDFIVMEIKQDGCWTNSANEFKTYSNNPQTSGQWKSCYVSLSSWIAYMNNTTPFYMITY